MILPRVSLEPWSSYLCPLWSWDDRCVPPGTVCLVRWGLANFFFGHPWTSIFLISTSQVAGIYRHVPDCQALMDWLFSFREGKSMQNNQDQEISSR
jgi:hypothetical protein